MQRSSMTRAVFLVFFLLLTGAAGQAAESTGGCHCFRERAFVPAEPFAADDYILL